MTTKLKPICCLVVFLALSLLGFWAFSRHPMDWFDDWLGAVAIVGCIGLVMGIVTEVTL